MSTVEDVEDMSALTRDEIDALVLTTGHRRDGYRVPDPIDNIKPGTCVALYMAVGIAGQIAKTLTARHPDVLFDVQIVAKAQRKGQVVLKCALSDLTQTLEINDVVGEAMLFVRWPYGMPSHQTSDIRSFVKV